MNTPLKKVVALIPCYNEEKGIGQVIKNFPRERLRILGFDLQVIVIDNNSKDRTREVALESGATVISEPRQGKGNAMRAGFTSISKDTDYVVMLDGDNTYRAEEILRLLEPLESGFCNVVVGSRLGGRISDGSMTAFNRLGNWMFSHLVRIFYKVNVTDVLTGYFAWTREALERLTPHLHSNGFAIEMEMVTKMAHLGEEMCSVPISYDARSGHTNLRPIYDGLRILKMLLQNLFWYPPKGKIRRIAFVSDGVFPYNKGGKEKRLHEVATRLARDHQQVHIYTMKWWEGPNTICRDGISFHAISKLYPMYVGERRSIAQALLFGFATFKLLFKRFDIIDVDHIPFFPLFSARIVTWVRGKKLYATWHEFWGRDYWMEYMKGPLGILGYAVERLSLYLPDVIISNSQHTTLRLQMAGVPVEIRTIPLGVDLATIYGAAPGSYESDVIFVGRLIGHKNADLLVKAISLAKASHPNIICQIIGNGPERANIERLIQELGLQNNIRLLDKVEDYSELYSHMKASKMLVLPSVREGFGLVAVEANAAGLPVITTTHPDNAAKELIREGVNGFLVEPSEEAITSAILKVLKMREEMEPRLEISQYDWNAVVQKIESALA